METQAGLQSHMHTYCTAGHYLQSIGRRVLKHILAVVKTTSLLSMSHVARARGVSLVVPQPNSLNLWILLPLIYF
jgi:hypothetical protein